jgi:hypothetical protein
MGMTALGLVEQMWWDPLHSNAAAVLAMHSSVGTADHVISKSDNGVVWGGG